MKLPESVERLASEVARSWTAIRSNYIIVAPPLSDENRLFQLLADKEFQHRVLGKCADRLAVARIGQSDFRKNSKLAAAVLKGWGLAADVWIDPECPLGALELGLETLKERDEIPIILVERFHDALKWLDGDFGVTLRDLENDHFLKTVVAIPVSLSDLRRRAEEDVNGSLFLQSDWGQGHHEKTLKGYSESEVAALLKARGLQEDFAKLMYEATAGLPELVERLADQIGTMDSKGFEVFLRAESPRLCRRLLEWLDRKGGDIYRRLAAESLNGTNVKIRGVSLSDHPWGELLLKRDGSFRCLMLGWASLERLSRERNRGYMDRVTEHARNRRFAQVDRLLPSPKSSDAEVEVWNALRVLNKFCLSADVYLGEWADSSRCLLEFSLLGSRSQNERLRKAAEELSQWRPLVDLICGYSARKKSGSDIRLEDFVCQQKSDAAFMAFIQLLQFRLKLASRLEPLPAMKSVIEHPESLIQVYSYYKFDLKFWNFDGLDDDTKRIVENLLQRSFVPSKKGQRLGFQELLWFGHAKAEQAMGNECLFGSAKDLFALGDKYRARCEQVHSASFASIGDWNDYRRSCQDLMELVAKAVLGDKTVSTLPDPAECFCELLTTLRDVPRSS